MTMWMITVANRDNAKVLIKHFEDKGYTYHYFRNVGTTFAVDSDVKPDHPLILSCNENKDSGLVQTTSDYQSLSLDTQQRNISGDNYAIARVIRRDMPWPKYSTPDTVATHFECIRNGNGVDIYSIDEDFDSTHVEFGGRASVINSIDQTFNDVGNWHGTKCMGAAAGATTGLARKSEILAVRLAGTAIINFASAFDDALGHYLGNGGSNRPAVLNISYGSTGGVDPTLTASVSACVDAGILVCTPAGNFRDLLDGFQRGLTEEDSDGIVTGGTTMTDTPMMARRLGFSEGGTGYGYDVDIWSPAQGMYLPSTGTSYETVSGTSFASPTTAGVAACLLQGYQRLTSREQVRSLKEFIMKTSSKSKVEFSANAPYYGNGNILYLDPRKEFEDIRGLVKI